MVKTINARTSLKFDIDQWSGQNNLEQGSRIMITFPDGDFEAYFALFGDE